MKRPPDPEARKQARLLKLGTNNPCCGTCGESDWRCIEEHHVPGNKRDDFVVPACANCHRKVTDDQKDHPSFDPHAEPFLDCVGHFLLCLADLLRLIVEKLTEYGHALIARATRDGAPA
ncbi:MAG TPA: hypothetical protein VGF77_02750 [Allosphingosinicella sp.]